jgi:outer membrane protein
MKKVFLIVLVCIFPKLIHAQVSKGTIFLGGSFGITSDKEPASQSFPEIKTTGFVSSPGVGYFLTDNLAIGIDANFGSSVTEQGASERTITSINLGPFVRYYVPTSGDKFFFMAEGGINLGRSKTEFLNPPFTSKGETSTFNFYISPGFSYFFSDKWSLDFQLAGISYTSFDPNTSGDSKNDKFTNFVFGAESFNPSLGFRFFVSK